jgi:hypothetical protein
MSAKAWTGLGVVAALVIALVAIQTPLEREQQTVSDTQQALVCLDCHRQANVNTNEGVVVSRTFCFSCHGTPESSFRSGVKARFPCMYWRPLSGAVRISTSPASNVTRMSPVLRIKPKWAPNASHVIPFTAKAPRMPPICGWTAKLAIIPMMPSFWMPRTTASCSLR